jgi:two-component system, response regulator PdtaR
MDKQLPLDGHSTVVLVEDEPLVRDLTVWALEDNGFAVVDFETADAALPYIEQHGDELALVITDVQMPGRINGLQLVDRLSRLWPRLQVLVTSGGPLVNPAALPSCAKFLAKPWRPADLASRARTLARAG